MMEMTGADLMVRLLERQGVETVAGIPGGANLPLYDALARRGTIRHVLARHEQAAGFMAQGMARVSGKPAVCLATSGPGAMNLLTAVADARLDSVPIVCITAQVPAPLIGTDAFQEVDTYGLTVPITKHNFLVRTTRELLEVIPEAFRIAVSGRPGPVLVDVPKDVQMAKIAFDAWPEPGQAEPRARAESGNIRQAAEMINRSQRPVLYVGGGVIQAGASASALALAEKGAIPTAMTLMALGAIPAENPLALGMLGMHAALSTNLLLEECDLLIALGARFDDRATGRVAQFCPRAEVLHIDIDPAELGKIRAPRLGIVGDVGQVLDMLLPMVEEQPRSEWLTRNAALRESHPLPEQGSRDLATGPGVIQQVAGLAEEGAFVATDVGQHQMWAAQYYPLRRPRQWLTSGGLGTMGFGLPTAMGAALARPAAEVICFSGDGSLLMNIQELATLAEENLNVKIVLLNNQALGLVRQQQDLFYEGRRFASDFRTRVNFCRIAEGFGIPAVDLGCTDDPRGALANALRTAGPCLIHAPISADAHVLPMVPPGGANTEMIQGGLRYANA